MTVASLNGADIAIIVIVLLSVMISVVRGFVREALSLVTWILAFWVAMTFSKDILPLVKAHVATPSLQTAGAFAILFIGTLIIGGIVNHLLILLVHKTGLTGTDRLLGIIFGFGRGVLLTAVLLLLAKLTPLQQDLWWRTSVLIPRFEPLEIWLHGLLPENVHPQALLQE